MTVSLIADEMPWEHPGQETGTVEVEIVVPVYNEEEALARSIYRLHAYLREHFPLSWAVTVVDNASRDSTWEIACALADHLDGVRALKLPEKGRGRALRTAWDASDAAVVAYMDVDLSTDLNALLPLVAPLVSGHSDLAIGTRLGKGARVVRGAKREIISRMYNLLLRGVLRAKFSDAQCGFKAVRADVARELLPFVEDGGWFFDTELLVLAQRSGLRAHEVPVDWVDDPSSTVDIAKTAWEDLKGVARLFVHRRRVELRTARSEGRVPGPPAAQLPHERQDGQPGPPLRSVTGGAGTASGRRRAPR